MVYVFIMYVLFLYKYIHTYMHACIHTRTCVFMNACVHVRVYAHVSLSLSLSLSLSRTHSIHTHATTHTYCAAQQTHKNNTRPHTLKYTLTNTYIHTHASQRRILSKRMGRSSDTFLARQRRLSDHARRRISHGIRRYTRNPTAVHVSAVINSMYAACGDA
jgi:hypothetical protein